MKRSPCIGLGIIQKNRVFEKFSPHITIGIGEVEGEKQRIKIPIQFSSSKLALCHLGNYCTYKEIVFSLEFTAENPEFVIEEPE